VKSGIVALLHCVNKMANKLEQEYEDLKSAINAKLEKAVKLLDEVERACKEYESREGFFDLADHNDFPAMENIAAFIELYDDSGWSSSSNC
jgi:hypothetical protein